MTLAAHCLRPLLGALLLLFALNLTGCRSLIFGQVNERAEMIEGLRVTREQLRLQARATINPITGGIIDTANEIMEQTDDPDVRLAAIKWKATAVPLYRETLFANNPKFAVLDTLALSYQMMDYFENGQGSDDFKSYAPIAYDCTKEIADTIREYMDSVTTTGDPGKARFVMREWASEHPIMGSLESRESIYEDASEISMELDMSIGAAVDAVVTTMDDLNYKIDVLSAQLPSQARWEMEILAYENLGPIDPEGVAERVDALLLDSQATLNQAEKTMANIPEMLTQERIAIMQDLEAKLDRSITALQAERQVIMRDLAGERKIVMDEVALNRIALTEDLNEQLRSVEQLLSSERRALVEDAEVMRQNLVNESFDELYVILLMASVYFTVMVFVVLWILDRRVWNRRAPAA
ncbi:MAG: hypothetical protein AAFX93_09420 [Verrucomicrobiota bacterium]